MNTEYRNTNKSYLKIDETLNSGTDLSGNILLKSILKPSSLSNKSSQIIFKKSTKEKDNQNQLVYRNLYKNMSPRSDLSKSPILRPLVTKLCSDNPYSLVRNFTRDMERGKYTSYSDFDNPMPKLKKARVIKKKKYINTYQLKINTKLETSPPPKKC